MIFFYRLNCLQPNCSPSPPCSPSCRCLEHDRSLSWQWAQHFRPQCRDQRVSAGDYSVFHLLSAQQAASHHPPDQCGAVHWASAELHGGHLWQVWDRRMKQKHQNSQNKMKSITCVIIIFSEKLELMTVITGSSFTIRLSGPDWISENSFHAFC